MAKTSFVLGKGTKVEIALLPLGSRVEPKRTTVTLAAEAVKDVTGGATIAIPVLGAGVLIPAGSYLAFVAPTSGKTVIVQTTADAKEGDATLEVVSIPETIISESVANYPLRLSARTAANLGRTAQRTSSITFDDDGYSDGLASSIEQTLECPGNWLPLDAGFATAEYGFTELREIYMWLTLPKISDAYSKGRVYSGPGSITGLPLGIPADGVITGNISLTFNGKPNYEPDTAAA